MGGQDAYLSWMDYSHLGQPLRAHMGVTPTEVDETYNAARGTWQPGPPTTRFPGGAGYAWPTMARGV